MITLVPDQQLPPSLVVTVEVIRAELSVYIGEYRDSAFSWEVTETVPLVFLVLFPSAEMLNFSTCDHVNFPINKFMISIQKAAAEPDTAPPLAQVWMLVYGLPCGAKRDHILKAISKPLGKLLTVDMDSMEGDGPVRVEILCQAPGDMDSLPLIFYFGKNKGRAITYELDLEPPIGRPEDTPLAPAPAPPMASQGAEDSQSKESSAELGDGPPPSASIAGPPTVGGNDTYGITGIPSTVGGRGVVQRAGLAVSTRIVYPGSGREGA
ncbi:hypothetical protein VPH35_013709 [Triticum aestivum]